MCDGFLGNTSLTTLVLARTRISEAGAYHLAQVTGEEVGRGVAASCQQGSKAPSACIKGPLLCNLQCYMIPLWHPLFLHLHAN
jgi:hypothetical protein